MHFARHVYFAVCFHARQAYIQHYQTLLQELQGDSEDTAEFPAAEQSESGESPDRLTPISKSALCCAIAISMLHARPVFVTLPRRNVLQGGAVCPSLAVSQ